MLTLKKKESDPQIKTDLTISSIEEIFDGEAVLYEDFYISANVFVTCAFLSIYGAVFILPFEDEADMKKGDVIRSYLSLSKNQAYILYYSDEKGTFVQDDRELIPVDDIYEGIRNLVYNFRSGKDLPVREMLSSEEAISKQNEKLPEFSYEGIIFSDNGEMTSDDEYTGESSGIRQRLSEEMMERCCAVCESLSGNERPDPDADIMTDDEGNEFIRKTVSKRILGVDTGLFGEKEWYQLSVMDSDKFMVKTGLLGCLGIHRFILGEIPQGILYLLTCGGLGFLPAIDILSLMTGNFSYRANVYNDDGSKTEHTIFLKKPAKKWMCAVMMAVSICMGIFLSETVYVNALRAFSVVMGDTVQNMDEEKQSDILEKFGIDLNGQ